MSDLNRIVKRNFKWAWIAIFLMLWFYPKTQSFFRKFAESNTFPLEVIAIACGVYALIYERDVHRKVDDINENVSTRYLPDWPKHGDPLIKLIQRLESGDELDIQVDSIGYLSFSSPKKFKEFLKQLKKAIDDGNTVRILTLDETTATVGNIEQFESNFPNLGNEIKAYVEEHTDKDPTRNPIRQTPFFRKRYTPEYVPEASDLKDFIELTMFVEDYYCNQLTTAGAQVATTSRPLYVEGPFFWLRHNGSEWKEMIFAYPPNQKTDAKGYAFRTYDSHLMEVFARQFNRDF